MDTLNVFQAACSYENFYFRDAGNADVFRVAARAKGFRRTQKVKVQESAQRPEPDGKRFSSLITSTVEDVRMDLNLTFVRINKPSKQWRAALQAQRLQPAIVVRSAAVSSAEREYRDTLERLMEKAKYHEPSEQEGRPRRQSDVSP